MFAAYSPDGKLLATGGLDDVKGEAYSLRFWDVATGKEMRRCDLPKTGKGGTEPPTGFAFSPSGDKLIAAIAEMDTYLFDVATGKQLHRLNHSWARRVAYAADGRSVFSIGGPTVRVWDVTTGKERFRELAGHLNRAAAVAVSPDGKTTATGGEDVRLWETKTGRVIRRIETSAVTLAFSPDGKTLVTGGGRSLRLWSLETGLETTPWQFRSTRLLRSVVFSPDGKTLAVGDEQAVVQLLDVATGQPIWQHDMQTIAESLSLAFSPDGKTLACAGAWNQLGLGGITLNLQGRVTVAGKEGYFVLLLDTTTGKEVRRLAGLKDNIKSVAFSPDGQTIAASSRDGRILLWDAATGKERLHIMAHPTPPAAGTAGSTIAFTSGGAFSPIPALAFAPGGKMLASAGDDHTIRLWDTTTARQIGALVVPDGSFTALTFTPDGKRLVSGNSDTTALVWDVKAAEGLSDRPVPPIKNVPPGQGIRLGGGGIEVRLLADGSTQMSGVLGKVDAEKGVLNLGGKSFTVSANTKFTDPEGKEIKDRLKASYFEKPGGRVTVTYVRKDGKETVTQVKVEAERRQ
jgi:WD40 repeat protein